MSASINLGFVLLAELPSPGGYISVFKWSVMVALVAGWLAVCQWVDKDALRLRYRRFTFNGVVVGAGALGVLLWLAIPIFAVGMLVYLVLVGTAAGTYVYLRNQLVSPTSRVLTYEHLAGLFRRTLPEAKPAPPAVRLLRTDHQELPALAESDPLYDGFTAGQALLADALARRAERVSLSPSARGMSVQYVIDGLPTEAVAMDRRTADLSIAYFKRIAGMDVNDRRRPQSGKLIADEPARPVEPDVLAAGYNVPATLPARNVRIEVRTSGTRAGETMQLLLADQSKALTLDQLGMTERQLQALENFRRGGGGVVVFGAAASVGSTTTFYRALRAHDAFMYSLQTLEEHPEAELENITQNAYKADAAEDVSFARQLQSIIRRGVDIIGVSLCKDKETAQLVARTAVGDDQTVKFYVEMAGRDAVTLLARWTALVGDLKLAMAPIQLLFAQTLMRTLCPGCKEAYRPDPQLLRKINLPADRIDKLYRPPTRIPTDKQGNRIACPLCQGTGYVGRTGVFEMLVVDDELRRLVVENASAGEIKKYCRSQKMLYLQEEALRKVIAGETSINEVVRVFSESK